MKKGRADWLPHQSGGGAASPPTSFTLLRKQISHTHTHKREAGVVAAIFVAFLAAVAATDMTKAKHYRPPVKTSLPLLCPLFFSFSLMGLVSFFSSSFCPLFASSSFYT